MRSIAVALLAVASYVGPASGGDDVNREILDAVRNGFEANRLLYGHARVEFDHTVGFAPNVSAAMESGPASGASSGRGRYSFDGADAVLERIFPEEKDKFLRSIRLLTDGTKTLRAWQSHPMILKGTDDFYSEVRVPISIGLQYPRESLIRIIDLATRKERGCHLESSTKGRAPGGEEVLVLKFDASDFVNEYWVDLERGAIPIATKSTNKKAGIFRYEKYSDLRKDPTLGWFPYEWRSYLSTGRSNTHVVKITKADFASPIPPTEFRLQFPRSTRVVDIERGMQYRGQVSWNLKNLPTEGLTGVEPSGKRADQSQPYPSPPDLPGELPGKPLAVSPLVAVVPLLLLASAVAVWRRRVRANA